MIRGVDVTRFAGRPLLERTMALGEQSCETLGAGEILLNCVDKDGQKDGFDLELVKVTDFSACFGWMCCVILYGVDRGTGSHPYNIVGRVLAVAASARRCSPPFLRHQGHVANRREK